jgi:putative transposase
MPNYHHAFAPGATFFFTVATYSRRPALTEPTVIESLRATVHDMRAYMPYEVVAWVVLPDRLQAVWRMP